jgi:hypothetical protein
VKLYKVATTDLAEVEEDLNNMQVRSACCQQDKYGTHQTWWLVTVHTLIKGSFTVLELGP